MIRRCISRDWLFKTEGRVDWEFRIIDDEYRTVDLPHDYQVTAERSAHCNGDAYNGYFPNRGGRYVKYLTFEKGLHYILDVDGAYMNTQIFLNENFVAVHPYGYTPFLTALTPYLRTDGANKLVITTDPPAASTRWYSGSGIYRDVFLWEGGDVRIEPWDLFISTVSAGPDRAEIRVRFTLTSDRDANVQLKFTITDADGSCAGTEALCAAVKPGKTEKEFALSLKNPRLWSPETPHLYTVRTEILENDVLLDTSTDTFGVRTVTADVQNGLLVNGKPVKLRGGCIHHDHGVLGAAAFPAAEERKVRLLKEAGFNALRTAHNPPSLAFLECCDRLGMIVMDEAFDVWNKQKRPNDYHWAFSDWCERDISYMVRRDRSHPCVFSYSIGNEILEIDGTSEAGKWSELLCAAIRKHDDTRFVTSGVQRVFANRAQSENIDPEEYREFIEKNHRHKTYAEFDSAAAEFEAPLDIVGRNYYYQNYLTEHRHYPDRVIWGSETHAITFYDAWMLTRENNFILGDFTWTAYDNMGEVGTGRTLWARDGALKGFLADYPWRTCYQGDLDLCGYRRPQSYFREAVWIGNTAPRIFVTHPEHFGETCTGTGWHWYDVNETWTFADRYIGQPVRVETYTDAEKIVWYVNGEPVGESIPEKGIASIGTVYRKGSITAAAYKDGKECARFTLETTGEADRIRVAPEQPEFLADNRDLCWFDIAVTDSEGRIVAEAGHEIACTVSGGELLGVFSGNPCNEDRYGTNRCHVFKGRALAVVRTKNPGTVGLKVWSSALASGYAEAVAR